MIVSASHRELLLDLSHFDRRDWWRKEYNTESSGGGSNEGCSVQTFYRDADGDSYGNPDDSVSACQMPTDFVLDNTDCDV